VVFGRLRVSDPHGAHRIPNKLFAGLGPGPADPHRQEFGPTFDLPAAAAGSTVGCGLWVYHASELAGRTFRILCEVRSAGGRSWNYVVEHTVEDPDGPHGY
jgi:hypothetical protein